MQLLYSWILVESLGYTKYTKYPSILSQPYLIGISPKAVFITNNHQGRGGGGGWWRALEGRLGVSEPPRPSNPNLV